MKPFHPTVNKVIRLIVVTSLGGLLPSVSLGQTIVWTDVDARKIQRKDVNGTEVQTMVQFAASGPAATQIHYDPVTAKLYYISGTTFQRANLDGSHPETIPTPSVGTFTLNVDSRKLYWINDFTFPSVLYRSELDGLGVESHTYPNCCLLTLEAVGDDLFFGAGGIMLKGIWRADADGSNEQYLHVTSEPLDLAYDPVENKIYVAGITEISRLNADGTGIQVLFQPLSAGQIVVDSLTRKMYWAERGARVIRRSNLDGSNVEDFVTASDVGNPNLDIRGLTIVYNSTPIPTLSVWGLMAMAAILLGAGLFVLRKQFNLRAYPKNG
jgi:hypothetical protein